MLRSLLPPERVTSRPVRRRHLVRPHGKVEVDAFVDCAHRSESVPLEECSACGRCVALPACAMSAKAEVLCTSSVSAIVSRARDALRSTAAGLTARDVLVLEPAMLIDDAGALLDERGLSMVAVVDDQRRPLGYVTRADLGRACGRGEAQRDVGSVLSAFTTTIQAETPVVLALAALGPGCDAPAPVVRRTGELVGVLRAVDVVRWLAESTGRKSA
jgi:CBS domain-containing protein